MAVSDTEKSLRQIMKRKCFRCSILPTIVLLSTPLSARSATSRDSGRGGSSPAKELEKENRKTTYSSFNTGQQKIMGTSFSKLELRKGETLPNPLFSVAAPSITHIIMLRAVL